LLSVEEAARRLSIGRSLLYEMVARGEVPSVKVGRCRRILRTDLERFVARLSGGEVQKSLRSF
jgi:excisionase family DNA binding protein